VLFGVLGGLTLLVLDAFNGVWYAILLAGLILFELLAGSRSGTRLPRHGRDDGRRD